MRPVRPARVSQPFADPGSYASRFDRHGPAGHHTGIDFGSAWPIPINRRRVRAVLPGRVTISEYNSTMGNWVGIYNFDYNLLVTYWHLDVRFTWLQDWVQVYETIGRVGSTGNSSAPHLHVQVNRGPDFDYHGHLDPEQVFALVSRRKARELFRSTKGQHPQD